MTTSPEVNTKLPKALTVRQFHEAIGGIIGINKLYGLAHSGRLKSLKIGSKILVLTSEVENFFAREGGLY
jgi:hypothetical protein